MDLNQTLGYLENIFAEFFGDIKIVEKGLLGFQGSYVELRQRMAGNCIDNTVRAGRK